jgi:hypothetical protein
LKPFSSSFNPPPPLPPSSQGGFDKKEYYESPELYLGTFGEKYAPYVSVIMNCMFWDYQFPRLMSTKEMFKLYESGKSRLLAIGDISCDPAGSIEFLLKTTSIDNPTYVYYLLFYSCHFFLLFFSHTTFPFLSFEGLCMIR